MTRTLRGRLIRRDQKRPLASTPEEIAAMIHGVS